MADKMATREAYGKTLIELGKTHPELVVMDADLSGSTKTAGFAKAYPDRFFNMGIAEQNMYGAAAGLALSGKTVCASTFAMFAAGRAFEIIRNSIGYTRANVKICATHAGITVGEDGASHQTFEDIALMRTIPGMTVINPSDGVSAARLLTQAVEMDGPCYIRLGRAAVPVFYGDDDEIILGRANTVRDGKDVTVIATGIMVSDAVEAAGRLAEERYRCQGNRHTYCEAAGRGDYHQGCSGDEGHCHSRGTFRHRRTGKRRGRSGGEERAGEDGHGGPA